MPTFENETIDFRLALDVKVDVTALLLTYGISDRIDFGVVLPFVSTELRGTSTATIIPFGTAGPPPHFFSGTPENPILTASRFSEGSSSGLGDVSARVKINLREGTPVSLAILAEGRFPTGSEEDLRGSGAVALRGLGIISARLGDFSPHANVGYLYRGRFVDNDAFLITGGFDQLLAPWATLAADLITEFQVGTSKLTVPAGRDPRGAVPPHDRRFVDPGPARRHRQRVARHQALAAAAGDVPGQRAVPAESRRDAARRSLDAGRRIHVLSAPGGPALVE